MFGKAVTLFRLFGFAVRVDASWLVIAALVTWSLAQGFFPSRVAHLSPAAYWWMGGVSAAGLFLSIVFHEVSHSLVARKYGLPMKGITLFIFGGVAEMDREPENPRTEFLMAAAGPVASILLGLVFFLLRFASQAGGGPPAVTAVLYYLAFINLLLAGFNLLPAFPLDGGRIFRSALWKWKGSLRWATRIAAQTGSGFGTVLIVLGIWTVFQGDFVGGMWWFLIGMFLQGAARNSYRQLVIRRSLEGEPVRRFMNPQPVTVPSWISAGEFVENYVYQYHFKMFPVVRDSQLVGCIHIGRIKGLPRAEWDQHSVQEFTSPCSAENTVTPETDAVQALSVMRQTGNSRLLVVEDGRLVGIVALKNLLAFLAVKLDLEEHAKVENRG